MLSDGKRNIDWSIHNQVWNEFHTVFCLLDCKSELPRHYQWCWSWPLDLASSILSMTTASCHDHCISMDNWSVPVCMDARGSFLLMPVMASNCPFYQSRESVWSISLYYKMSLKAKVKCKVKIFVLSNLCSGEIEWNVLLNPLERQNGQGILVIGAPYVTKYCWFLTLINIECVILNIMVCSKL